MIAPSEAEAPTFLFRRRLQSAILHGDESSPADAVGQFGIDDIFSANSAYARYALNHIAVTLDVVSEARTSFDCLEHRLIFGTMADTHQDVVTQASVFHTQHQRLSAA